MRTGRPDSLMPVSSAFLLQPVKNLPIEPDYTPGVLLPRKTTRTSDNIPTPGRPEVWIVTPFGHQLYYCICPRLYVGYGSVDGYLTRNLPERRQIARHSGCAARHRFQQRQTKPLTLRGKNNDGGSSVKSREDTSFQVR